MLLPKISGRLSPSSYTKGDSLSKKQYLNLSWATPNPRNPPPPPKHKINYKGEIRCHSFKAPLAHYPFSLQQFKFFSVISKLFPEVIYNLPRDKKAMLYKNLLKIWTLCFIFHVCCPNSWTRTCQAHLYKSSQMPKASTRRSQLRCQPPAGLESTVQQNYNATVAILKEHPTLK